MSQICEAGGKRLINLAGRLSVRLLPNPMVDKTEIVAETYERGMHTLKIVDAAGRIVWSNSWQPEGNQRLHLEQINATLLSVGLYHVILESPTRSRVEPLSVVR